MGNMAKRGGRDKGEMEPVLGQVVLDAVVKHHNEVLAKAHAEGQKLDDEKDRWDLLPVGSVRQVVRVLTYGARKYAPHNWQKVSHARERYFAASLRHLSAWWEGEKVDPESGLPHLAHATCCLLFLMWFEP